MAQPQFIGWYHKHPVRLYRDDDNASPWRIVFEPRPCVDPTGKHIGEMQLPEIRERTEQAAKDTAQALAQNDYLSHLAPVEKIEWRDLR